MIRLNDLSYSFPQKNLYTDVSFELKEGHHCAFIGTSGSGKSTLINILMNPDKYMYDGLLEIDPGCRIGYVSQFFEKDRNPVTSELIFFPTAHSNQLSKSQRCSR